jgi:phage tail-like protein
MPGTDYTYYVQEGAGMAQFTVNPLRFDPYKNYKFQVVFPGNKVVAALAKCSGIKKTTEMIEWREAGNPSTVRKMPGRTNYQSLTMEAGVTHDTAFEDWAQLCNKYTVADDISQMSLATFRRDIKVQEMNEQGTIVISYDLFGAWVAEYQAMPDLDSNAHAVAITSIKIDYEGFQRDPNYAEPKET